MSSGYYLIIALDAYNNPLKVYSTDGYKEAKEFTLRLRTVYPDVRLLKVLGEVNIDPMNTEKLKEMLDEK